MLDLDAKHLRGEFLKLCDEEGKTPYEIWKQTELSKQTIYDLLQGRTARKRRSTARLIAEATGRKLRIENDKAYFDKQEQPQQKVSSQQPSFHKMEGKEPDHNGRILIKVTEEEMELLNLLKGLPNDQTELIIRFLRTK